MGGAIVFVRCFSSWHTVQNLGSIMPSLLPRIQSTSAQLVPALVSSNVAWRTTPRNLAQRLGKSLLSNDNVLKPLIAHLAMRTHINSIDAMALEVYRILSTPINLQISGWQVHLSKAWSFTIDALTPLQRKCIAVMISRDDCFSVRQRLPNSFTHVCHTYLHNDVLQNYLDAEQVLQSIDYLLKEIHCIHLIHPYRSAITLLNTQNVSD